MTRSSSRGDPGASASSIRALLLLLVLATGTLGVFIYGPTLRLSFAYDDVDFVNVTGDVLAGKMSPFRAALTPNGEHLIPLVRLAFMVDLFLFGTSALPLRVLALCSHVLSGVFLGLLAWRLLPARSSALGAALTYVGAAGLSSMWIWGPNGAGVPVGLLGITGGLLAVVCRDRLGPRRSAVLAALGVAFALLWENTLAPLALAPLLLYEHARRKEGSKRGLGPLSLVLALLASGAAFVTALIAMPSVGSTVTTRNLPGLAKAVFLLAASPYRLLFPGTVLPRPFGIQEGFPLLACLYGGAAGLLLVMLFLLVRRAESRPLVEAGLLCGVASAGALVLVGLGRFDVPPDDLYGADRYFFTLLIPTALLAGALAHGAQHTIRTFPRTGRPYLMAGVAACVGIELALHRSAMLRRVPFSIYDQHQARFRQIGLLADFLADAGRALPLDARPVAFPDGFIILPDVHNGGLTARVLLFAVRHAPIPNLVLGGRRVTDRDERFLNPVLEKWSGVLGEARPSLVVRNGILINTRQPPCADFRVEPWDPVVARGLFPWEHGFRWMAREADLRLTFSGRRVSLVVFTPRSALQRRFPEWTGWKVTVSLLDPRSTTLLVLGQADITSDDEQRFTFEVPETLESQLAGQVVTVRLASDRTWRPAELWPTNLDARELSVQVRQVGFCD